MDRRYVIVRPARSRLGRFVAVGAVATFVDVVGAVVLTGIWPRVPADAVALLVASTMSGLLHRRVTLRGDEFDRWIRRPGVFAGVALVAGAVDVTVFSLLPLAPLGAKLVALAAAALVRVVAHRVVLFRVVRRDQARPARRPPPPGELRLSVVIPAYDEEARIGATVAAVREALAAVHDDGGIEIIVVDDGSSDATADAARRGGADRVVVQRPNRGKGAAVRAGVAVARGRTVVFTDADLSYPPHQIVGVLAAVEEGWDLVIGDRRHTDTTTRAPASRLRAVGSRLVNWATQILLLGNYRDTQCGLKGFRSDVARILFGAGVVEGFAFDIELLHLAERYGLSLREIPVELVHSATSSVSALTDGIAVFADILRIRRRARRGLYPALAPGALPPAAGGDRWGSDDGVGTRG